MENLIFAIGEDGVLSVFDTISTVRRDCEGIDVESGVWEFFNSRGVPLRPVFHRPNIVKNNTFWPFDSIASSQEFDLVTDVRNQDPTLLVCLARDIRLEKNNYFDDLDLVRKHLKNEA